MPVKENSPRRDRRHGRRSQAERTAATTRALIDAATELFAERGYVDAAREDICARAGVTRGALDHHFDGKKGLFRAVVEHVETRLNQRIAAAALAETDPVDQLRAGCHTYVEAATEPAVRRILLLDGRAVLGWEAWEEIQVEHGLGLTIEALRAIYADRDPARPLEPLAHMLLAALTEAAMYVAAADDPAGARQAASAEIDRMLDGWFGR